VPGWHSKTKQLVKDKKLIVLGIAPEQHGDRMALFLQWKGMEDMVVMLDSYNLLGLKAVPLTLLIDESGVIRSRNPRQGDLDKFLATPPAGVGTASKAPRAQLETPSTNLKEGLVSPDLESAEFLFRMGVAHRKAYDRGGAGAEPEHFTRALIYWRRALEADPSNYIWRRRLQQYGPRLDKPYPFYDWIKTARRELWAKGINPRLLLAEPMGAEIAQPLKQGAPSAGKFPHPDPDNKLSRDLVDIVKCGTFVVPHTRNPLKAVRVLVTLTPNPARKAKWNDEAGVSTVRLVPPEGWQASQPVTMIAPSPGTVAAAAPNAPRHVEFELRRTGEVPPNQAAKFEFQLYYNVCYGEDRVCQFFRRDISVDYALTPREEDVPEQ
jgi:hypothetical protein